MLQLLLLHVLRQELKIYRETIYMYTQTNTFVTFFSNRGNFLELVSSSSTGIVLRSISEHSIMDIHVSRMLNESMMYLHIYTDNVHTRTHTNFLTRSIHTLK